MKILLRDLNPALIAAWTNAFEADPEVSISQGEIFDLRADAIVSPANSFGFMDGGIDLVYSEHFGWQLEDRLRALLLAEHDGELPVGQAVVVPTEATDIPWLVSAPTMRVPMDVSRTAHAYLAFRAALRAVRAHNLSHTRPITSLLCPGLCTAVGRMSPTACATQMHAALSAHRKGVGLAPQSLAVAVAQHIKMTD